MSTHKAEVIRVDKIHEHPNADSLGIVNIRGFTCCVRLDDFKEGDLAVYIEPDTVVSKDPMFDFLGEHKRVRVRRFRGVLSQGLLMPAPKDTKEGDDVFEQWGLEHYEPPLPMSADGDNEGAPPGYYPKYDIENFNRYPNVFEEGEEIVASEKVHGCNSKYLFIDGRMRCGSHTQWKKQNEQNLWWQALKQNPEIEEWCRENPGLTLYAETYGQVQNLTYGTKKGQYRIAGFDVLKGNKWLDWDEVESIRSNLPWVPVLYRGPYSEAKVRELAEGDSTVSGADHVREGCVVKSVKERTHLELGRVVLKIVSNVYLEGKTKKKIK